MVVMPTGMIAVLVLLLIEARLATRWSPFYFNNGLRLYARVVNADMTGIRLEDLRDTLNDDFKGTGFTPSILFEKIGGQTLGFREKTFELSLLSYTPLMHGKIEIDDSNIRISGIANWYPIAFMCLWYSILLPTISFDVELLFLSAPAVIFGVIYMAQSRRYNQIAARLVDNEMIKPIRP